MKGNSYNKIKEIKIIFTNKYIWIYKEKNIFVV